MEPTKDVSAGAEPPPRTAQAPRLRQPGRVLPVALVIALAVLALFASFASAQPAPEGTFDEGGGAADTDVAADVATPAPTDTPAPTQTVIAVPTGAPTLTPTPLPTASAALTSPGASMPGSPTPTNFEGALEEPKMSATLTVNQPFEVRGWVVDKTAQGWAGIDEVRVFAQPLNGKVVELGSALRALPRPDVAQTMHNEFWGASGFSYQAQGLPVGIYLLSVQAHAPNGETWMSQVLVSVAAPAGEPDPSIPRYNRYGYRVAASPELWGVFEYLQSRDYGWVMNALTEHKTAAVVLDVLPEGQYGAFARAQNVVVISPKLLVGGNEVTAAALIHLAIHVQDDQAKRLGSPAQCVSSERLAVRQAADFWRATFGTQGRDPIVHPYDALMNSYVNLRVKADDLLGIIAGQSIPPDCSGILQ